MTTPAIWIGDRSVSLCEAVKLAGGAGRVEKLWRTAAQDSGKSGRGLFGRDMARSKENEYARRQVPLQQALAESTKASEWSATIRAAIAVGNAAEVDAERSGIELDAALLS
jgi:hypothetical protein